MQGFIKVTDKKLVGELSEYGYTPFSESGGVFSFAKTDDLVKLLSSRYSKSQFSVSNKLTFGG